MVSKPNAPQVIDLRKPGAVLLPTVSVKVHAGEKSDYIRGMVAWASQFNIISEKCMKQFDLPLVEGPVPSLHGLGGGAIQILGTSYIKFSSRYNEDHIIALQVYVAKRINSSAPSATLHPIVRECVKDLQLADPYFDQPGEVDLVLGVTFCPLVLKQGRHPIPDSDCCAMDSIFGWIVVGKAPMKDPREQQANPQSYLCMQ